MTQKDLFVLIEGIIVITLIIGWIVGALANHPMNGVYETLTSAITGHFVGKSMTPSTGG